MSLELLLEEGEKYVCRNRPDVKYIKVLGISSISTLSYGCFKVEVQYLNGKSHTSTVSYWCNGFFREDGIESDHDLVAIYEEPTVVIKTACSHPRKTNVSFSVANPIWACAACGCDWVEPKKEQINMEFEII